MTVTPVGGAQIPRTIWLMWWQGLEHAPELVRHCLASWQRHNPTWNVVFLDETNYRDYADVEAIFRSDNDLKVQAKADVIRLYLLAHHGGVWADATCFCCRPLDEWLDDYAAAGFFAFDRPSRDRLIDIWFLASSADCYLTGEFYRAAERYWLHNAGLKLRPSKTLFDRAFIKLLSTSVGTSRLWFSYPVRRWLRVYPYMWPPFLFARLLHRDPRCRELWRSGRKLSADVPHRLQQVGLLEPLTETVKSEIDRRHSPLYKLNWRVAAGAGYEGSVLQYLLERPPA